MKETERNQRLSPDSWLQCSLVTSIRLLIDILDVFIVHML